MDTLDPRCDFRRPRKQEKVALLFSTTRTRPIVGCAEVLFPRLTGFRLDRGCFIRRRFYQQVSCLHSNIFWATKSISFFWKITTLSAARYGYLADEHTAWVLASMNTICTLQAESKLRRFR
jgi:hypothetical protein